MIESIKQQFDSVLSQVKDEVMAKRRLGGEGERRNGLLIVNGFVKPSSATKSQARDH